MQQGVTEQLKPFNYYSIDQFQYKQLISRSKYFVGHFVHKQSHANFVIKEIPYSEDFIVILKRLQRIKSNNMVQYLGISILKSKSGWMENQRLKNDEKEREEGKQYVSLLFFMQKYEMNLLEYVHLRRRKMQYFSQQEINTFLLQILGLLEQLQKQNLAHRDIKPENILINQGKYLLSDFDNSIEVKTHQRPNIELTTVQYSSPQFLRFIRYPKDKYFDPFKLDVYSFGLTLLFMCSMGKFSLEERSNFIYESSERSHADFIKQQRRKWILNNSEYKSFNSIIKIMLQEDEYKRDDFIILMLKTKSKSGLSKSNQDDNLSDDNSNNSKSSAKLKIKKLKKEQRAKRNEVIKRREFKVYGILNLVMIIIFILLCAL